MLEKYGSALADFNKAVQWNDKDDFIYRNRSMVGRTHSAAVADLNTAIRLRPEDPINYFVSGCTKQEFDTDGAIADYIRFINMDPDNAAEAYILRGGLKAQKGDFDGAFSDYMSPVTSKPASRGRIKTGHSEMVY
jgi:tetratricopeptide (TPR) repeat protein